MLIHYSYEVESMCYKKHSSSSITVCTAKSMPAHGQSSLGGFRWLPGLLRACRHTNRASWEGSDGWHLQDSAVASSIITTTIIIITASQHHHHHPTSMYYSCINVDSAHLINVLENVFLRDDS
eukprot:scpid56398/ scgid2959/ 